MLFHRGLEAIAEASKNANAFFQLHAPWNMKEGPEKQTILFIVCETARIANVLLQPVVPQYARRSLTKVSKRRVASERVYASHVSLQTRSWAS